MGSFFHKWATGSRGSETPRRQPARRDQWHHCTSARATPERQDTARARKRSMVFARGLALSPRSRQASKPMFERRKSNRGALAVGASAGSPILKSPRRLDPQETFTAPEKKILELFAQLDEESQYVGAAAAGWGAGLLILHGI